MTECQVRLDRDALSTPWGVRLQGGRDFKTPLTVQRVFVGSPADGEVHRGDVIISVDNYDASGLSHKQGQDLFKNAGGSISLRIRRAAGPRAVGLSAAPSHSAEAAHNHNQSYRSRPLDTIASKPAPALGAFSPKSSSSASRMPHYGGGGSTMGTDYGRHPHHPQAQFQQHYQPTNRGPDPMLSRVQQSLNDNLYQGYPGDLGQQPEEEPVPFKSVRDLQQNFKPPQTQRGYGQAQPPRTRQWRKPENMGGPSSLMEPGWRAKPKAPGWSSVGTPQGRPHSTPNTPPAYANQNQHQPSYPSSQTLPSAGHQHHQQQQQQQQQQQRQPQQQPHQLPSSGRPAWAGSLRTSGAAKPWEMQQDNALAPSAGEQQYHQQPNAMASPGGAPVAPHQPRVQSVHYAPGDAPQYRQNDPDASGDAKVVHSQYNTPIGLYSRGNVQEALSVQTTGKPGQGTLQVTGGDGKKVFNPAQSDVYRLLQEQQEEMQHGPRRGGQQQQQQQQQPQQQQPQSARYQDHAGQEMRYDGYQDPSIQSPSMQALGSRYGDAEVGTSDF